MVIKSWMTQEISSIEVKLTANDIEKILNDLSNEDLQSIIIEVLENKSKVYDYLEQYIRCK